MYKSIKVDKATHLALRVGAFNRNITIKEHIARMAGNLVNGEIFDVEAHGTDWLEAVKNDIEIELEKRKNKKDLKWLNYKY